MLKQFDADWKDGPPVVEGWDHSRPDAITRAKTLVKPTVEN